ncbi:MAG: protein kinase [Verrucomicrobia bacterium]|nr:protein kinase [Verrucomicrobiota bacterium]
MMLRVSREDTILYASQSLLEYLGVEKEAVVGESVKSLSGVAGGELGWRLARVRDFVQPNMLVTDADGRVFEIKTTSERGVLDVVLDEVTDAGSISEILSPVCGTPFDELNEEELRTVRTPDLRFLTVSRTRLHTTGRLAGALPPMDQRILTNAFLDEVSEALLERGCTLTPSTNSSVAGLAGAPRYHADHAMRMLAAAFDQMDRVARLREAFFLEGKEMPPASCGIASGDAVVGTFGGHRMMQYTAEGQCVETAEVLSRIAGPGEILISKPALENLLNNLPAEWECSRVFREEEAELGPYSEHAGLIRPIEGEDSQGVWFAGPGLSSGREEAVFVFEALFELFGSAGAEPVVVLRASRAGQAADLPKSGDEVLSSGFLHRMGKYRLSEVIGTGGMGRVWKAQDVYGNTVAIKTLKLPEDATKDAIRRFRREAEIMAGLPHRNICRIFEMSEHEGTHYIVMEFVDGLSLADVLHAGAESSSKKSSDLPSLIAAARSAKSSSRQGEEQMEAEAAEESARARTTMVLPVDQTLGIMEKVCEAVEFAHTHGVLHRDLKPGNILLRGDGEPLVADFGLAKQSGKDEGASISVSGNVLGTVENMAPEQAQSSKTVDARADVYALGTILYQMSTGHRHFKTTGNILSDIQTLQTHVPERPRSLNPQIDQDLEIIILKSLQADPEHRYRGVRALLSDIRRYRNGEAISARPMTAFDLAQRLIRRNRAASAVAFASLAIIVALTGFSIWFLSRQLATAEAERDKARAAEASAIESQKMALENQRLAEEKEKEALSSKARAEQQAEVARRAHAEKNEAELAALEERKKREQYAALSGEERRKREEAEASALAVRQELEQKNQLTANATQTEIPPPHFSPEEQQRNLALESARQEIAAVDASLASDLGRAWLNANEKTPKKALDRLGDSIERVSNALVVDPTSAAGWRLKGRLHLAAMEFSNAADSFGRAGSLTNSPVPPTGSSLDDRLEILAKRSRVSFGEERNETATALMRFPDAQDRNAGLILQFFSDRPEMRKSLVPPMGRNQTAPELALDLMLENNWSVPPEVSGGPAPKPFSVSISEPGANLSALNNQPVKQVVLRGGGADSFDAALRMPLESIEVREAEVSAIPPTARALSTLGTAIFATSKLTAPVSLSNLRNVQALDLSNTGMSDLSPLARCLKIRRLDLGGLKPDSLAPISRLPLLIDLTVSPETARDPEARKVIDGMKKLTYLRTPEDPPRQTIAEFRQKYPLE